MMIGGPAHRGGLVYRIERRHAVRLPPSRPPATPATHGVAFWTPIPHLWSVRMPEHHTQHVVLLRDRDDAIAMTHAIAAYASHDTYAQEPTEFDHLRALFQRHFEQHPPQPTDLVAVACDIGATLNWATPRGIGLLSIAKITRHPTNLRFVVPTIVLPTDTTHDHHGYGRAANKHGVDAMRTACREDYSWQVDTF